MRIPICRPFPLTEDCSGGKHPFEHFEELVGRRFNNVMSDPDSSVYERVSKEARRASAHNTSTI